jgi:Skp family chaperone for outer membrane proteins
MVVVWLALAAFAHMGANSAAWAQKRLPAPVIGVVDVQSIMQNAEAAKHIRTQIQKAQSTFQQSLQGKNDELKKLDQDLQQQRNVLAPEAFQQRQRDFEQKVSDAQRDVQERRGKLETAFSNAMQQVEAAVVQIVDQLAKESGASLVVNKAAVLYSQGELDLTPEVLKRLNAKLPSVAVVVPK